MSHEKKYKVGDTLRLIMSGEKVMVLFSGERNHYDPSSELHFHYIVRKSSGMTVDYVDECELEPIDIPADPKSWHDRARAVMSDIGLGINKLVDIEEEVYMMEHESRRRSANDMKGVGMRLSALAGRLDTVGTIFIKKAPKERRAKATVCPKCKSGGGATND